MELEGKISSKLPPGFRFHPTDEELIIHYLTNQVALRPCPVSIIPEVNIYKFDPWDLPDKSELTENEWYFFTPRDRKYPNGVRPNRSTVSGYWKATGTDKAIHSGSKYVGVKKSLVFYTGRPPKGTKTDWIMHEYCLTDKRTHGNKKIGSMILDNWVLCRIYKKKKIDRIHELKVEESNVQTDSALGNEAAEQQMKFPRTFSITQFLDIEHMAPLSEIISDTSYDPNFGFQTSMIGTGINGGGGGGDMTCQYTSSQNSLIYNFSS